MALEQAVFDAALAFTDVKREADKVFRTGLSGIPAIVESNAAAREIAIRMSQAGMQLAIAVDAYRRHS